MKKTLVFLVLALFLASITFTAGCKPKGSVSGTIKDNYGVAAAGIEVKLGDLKVTTDSKGAYIFEGVKDGDYVLKIEDQNYNPFAANITVKGSAISKDVTLEIFALAKIKRDGKLVAGSDTTYAPFEYVENNVAIGFDVDLISAIAEELGVKAEILTTAWDGIIPSLQTYKFDILISAMTILPEREKEISFSTPYYRADMGVMFKKELNIKTAEDLVGKIVGVQVATTGEEAAELIKGIKQIKSYPDIQLATQDLELGRIHAVVNDFPVSAFYAKDKPGLNIISITKIDNVDLTQYYGIGMRKQDKDLKAAIDTALKNLVQKGKYQQIYKKWFGKDPEFLP